MQSITMADGTIFENGRCGYFDDSVTCFLPGYELNNIYETFFNPNATRTIVCDFQISKTTYEGYTRVISMLSDRDGCSVCLVKPTNTEA